RSSDGGNGATFGYHMESKGTRTLISLLIPALQALSQGSLLAIDELDTSLHPDLALAFISLFANRDSNPNGAQLLFSTHDVTILSCDLLRQDEIWMADKNRAGVSKYTPLTEFKLRSRDDIEKAYRNGRLGGVPEIDDFAVDVLSASE
ncbi:MAG: AAA family ATPase, partial [Gemmatimonadota bacterium]|nr:AAA family ATPase [Gemmatimonadota bacterium]